MDQSLHLEHTYSHVLQRMNINTNSVIELKTSAVIGETSSKKIIQARKKGAFVDFEDEIARVAGEESRRLFDILMHNFP